MKHKTVKSLDMLAKLKRMDLVEKQKALAEMQIKLVTLNQKVKDLITERNKEIECSRQDSSSRLNLQIYLDGLRRKEIVLKKHVYQLVDIMIPVQESVQAAFKDVKSLELSKENLQNQIQYEEEKAEQAFFDEISLQSKVGRDD
jgi:flagellar export protein FliJ